MRAKQHIKMEKISVKNLIRNDVGATESVSISADVLNLEMPEGIAFHLISGKAKLMRLEETILVTGDFWFKAKVACDRCLAEFEKEISFPFEREYEIDRQSESEEGLYVDKYFDIDLSEPVREDIILAIPTKNICKEECKGLCPHCGKNLNNEKCDCEKINNKNKE